MKIALFGAGQDGVKALYSIGIDRVQFFIDNNRIGEIKGIPIKALNQIDQNEKNDLLVLITSKKYKDEMIDQLKNYGFENYLMYTNSSSEIGYEERLSLDQWGNIYNESILNEILERIDKNTLSVQSQEMLRITKAGQRILEIGCGSGETSLVLAKNKRLVTAIDYSQRSVDLVKKLVKKTGYAVNMHCMDAMHELPFKNRSFDVVFQAGLLEHFTKEQRINMLLKWKRVCGKMVSLVPNAHCIAYRAGKCLSEKNHTWNWGMEIPQSSLREEFEEAGYINIKEYSIGEYHALDFLPKDHYLRIAISRLLDDNKNIKDWGQGYLLVTVAENPES